MPVEPKTFLLKTSHENLLVMAPNRRKNIQLIHECQLFPTTCTSEVWGVWYFGAKQSLLEMTYDVLSYLPALGLGAYPHL